ncbi:MAG TPA: rhodanese-like domain-containing protein [Syntrophorhabdaceae bacterium]|nr:rhodanese-like domain-containing protein [Syntrophorhabdaceae bacterium]
MKRCIFLLFFIVIFFYPLITSYGQDNFEPILSTEWLKKNMDNPSVIILDIRGVQEYKEGHIPGSVNLTFTAWRTMEKNLDCQLPPEDELNDTVCSIGLQKYKHVIIVGKTSTDLDCVNMTRVAWTLKYAGIKGLGILNGGFNSWQTHNLPIQTGWQTKEKARQKCKWDKSVVATKEHLIKVMDTAAIIDTRPEKFYIGLETDPKTKRKGHIPKAINLPYSLVFKKDGAFEDKKKLMSIAYKTIGDNREREVIVLCCNGQYASSWWFVLSEVLGYKKVSIYDGSMEEWCRDEGPLIIESEKNKD